MAFRNWVEYRAIEKLADAGVEFFSTFKKTVLDLDDITKNDTQNIYLSFRKWKYKS